MIHNEDAIGSTAQTLERLFHSCDIPKRRQPDLATACGLQDFGLSDPRGRVLRCKRQGCGTFNDGKTAHEVQIVNHPQLYRLSYSMSDPTPFPWNHYFCTQQLQSLGAGQTHFLYRVFLSQWSDRGRGPRHVTRFLSRRLRGHRPRLERQLHDSRGTITMFSSLFLLFWSEVTDHAGLERWSASPAGRNVLGKLLGFVLYPQGEGYHLVHHLHPGIPANGLAEAHAKLLSFTIYREKDKLLSLCRT
jgi:Fatty acid desaturase